MNEQRGNGRSNDDNRRGSRMHEQSMQREHHDHDEQDRGRWGDERGNHDNYGNSERGFGQGQSGYMAGRYSEDRSLGRQGMNQGGRDDGRGYSHHMGYGQRGGDETSGGWYGGGGGGMGGRIGGGMGVDDRWSGRGGEDFARGYGNRDMSDYAENRQRDSGGGYGGGRQMSGPQQHDRNYGGYGGESYGRGMGNMAASGEWRGGYEQSGRGFGSERGFDQRPSHRGKGPKNFTRSDDRIREQVCEALENDHNIDASEIEVEVKNGEVILKGTVDDRNIKRMAEDCVLQLSGINEVQNQLRVGKQWQAGSSTNGRGNQSQNGQVGTSTTETQPSKHRA
jgi:osmotically-inducible protein OsmY